jgi:hypothetical protein
VSKKGLPLLQDEPRPAPKRPSVDVARARLGGKPDGDDPLPGFPPGQRVSFALSSGARRSGVVIYACAAEVHVLLDSVRLRRFPPDDVAREDGVLEAELGKLAADARIFGLLEEGQPVRFTNEAGELHEGRLIERCRYGALVLREDGAIVAVGFRKLWPALPATAAEA